MSTRYIWVKGKRYYYYDTYSTFKDALEVGKRYLRRNESRYFILPTEEGFLFPQKRYRLYLSRVMRLFG